MNMIFFTVDFLVRGRHLDDGDGVEVKFFCEQLHVAIA